MERLGRCSVGQVAFARWMRMSRELCLLAVCGRSLALGLGVEGSSIADTQLQLGKLLR